MYNNNTRTIIAVYENVCEKSMVRVKLTLTWIHE